MIGLWLAIALLTALVVGLLVLPLVRPRRPAPPRGEYDLAIYRDSWPRLSATPSAASWSANRRRRRGPRSSAAFGHGRGRTRPRVIGRPEWPGGGPMSRGGGVGGSIRSLSIPGIARPPRSTAGRAPRRSQCRRGAASRDGAPQRPPRRENERDPGQHRGLDAAGSFVPSHQRFAEAAEAFRRAVDSSDRPADALAAYGEARVLARDGAVGLEDRAIFEEILAKNPREPRARYYIGAFQAQQGDLKGALQSWVDLIAASPADAPWLDEVRARVANAERN